MLSCALFCVSEDRSTPLAERSAERPSFLDGASFLDGGALADGDLGLVSLRALRVAFAVLYFRLACSAQDCARELGVGGTPPAPAGDDGVSLGGGGARRAFPLGPFGARPHPPQRLRVGICDFC